MERPKGDQEAEAEMDVDGVEVSLGVTGGICCLSPEPPAVRESPLPVHPSVSGSPLSVSSSPLRAVIFSCKAAIFDVSVSARPLSELSSFVLSLSSTDRLSPTSVCQTFFVTVACKFK